jgi:hypothetical protein
LSIDRWMPSSADHTRYFYADADPPHVGSLLGNERTVYRVLDVRERDLVDWDPNDEGRFRQASKALDRGEPNLDYQKGWDGRPETWCNRPRAVVVQPVSGGKPKHLRFPHRGWRQWYALPEHYAVCVSCGEPYPCLHFDAEREAGREMKRVEQLMSVPPGGCWHCLEPITSRQKAFAFPGENLLLPGGPPPSFHQRSSGGCYDAAYQYRKRWLAADPARGDLAIFEDGAFPNA